jgi:hypothetical protein
VLDNLLDAKYNDLLDHTGFRIGLLALTFTVWVMTAIGVLMVA